MATDERDDTRKQIAANLREHAHRRGVSLRALSKRAGVGEAQVYRVCRGEAWPSPEWLARVAKALGVHASELLRTPLIDVAEHVTYIRRMLTVSGPEKLYTIRMKPAERARVDALAEHYALPVADVLRMLVKRDADALGFHVSEAGKGTKRGPRK